MVTDSLRYLPSNFTGRPFSVWTKINNTIYTNKRIKTCVFSLSLNQIKRANTETTRVWEGQVYFFLFYVFEVGEKRIKHELFLPSTTVSFLISI